MNNFIERLLAVQYRSLLFPKDFCGEAIFGFECNDGWGDLIQATLWLVQQRARMSPLDVKVTQVKEKFGQLRIYHRGGDESIGAAFDIAELVSGCVCEICGIQGEVISVDGWLQARCSQHSPAEKIARVKNVKNNDNYIASYVEAVDAILSFFGEGAVLWVQQHRTAFAGRRPCELLATEEGCQAIYLMLKRLEYGVGV
ncbi:MbcA/ParS/Xre antitoxin family protein [Pseudomonas sp. S2_E02]